MDQVFFLLLFVSLTRNCSCLGEGFHNSTSFIDQYVSWFSLENKTQKETVKRGWNLKCPCKTLVSQKEERKNSAGLLLFVFSERKWESGPPRVCVPTAKQIRSHAQGLVESDCFVGEKSVRVSWQIGSSKVGKWVFAVYYCQSTDSMDFSSPGPSFGTCHSWSP